MAPGRDVGGFVFLYIWATLVFWCYSTFSPWSHAHVVQLRTVESLQPAQADVRKPSREPIAEAASVKGNTAGDASPHSLPASPVATAAAALHREAVPTSLGQPEADLGTATVAAATIDPGTRPAPEQQQQQPQQQQQQPASVAEVPAGPAEKQDAPAGGDGAVPEVTPDNGKKKRNKQQKKPRPTLPPGTKPFEERLWLYMHRSCSQDPEEGCNGKFKTQLADATKYAQELGFPSSHILAFGKLPDKFMNESRWARYVAPKLRGRGFWFWKAALLEYLLDGGEGAQIRDGDWVAYVDGDRYWRMKRLLGFARVKDAEDSPDMLVQGQPQCEYLWTRGDVFARFGLQLADPHYGLTMQYKAQTFMIRVNAKTRAFARHWTTLCADYHLISGEVSTILPDHKDFKHTREDQSLLSMLIKASRSYNAKCKDGTTVTPAEEAWILAPNGTKVPWAPHPEFGIPGLTFANGG